MATLTEQTDQVKRITTNIEETYQNLRKVARNLSALLIVNRATCDEIKTYNLYALSIYDAQRAMLANLRANGVADAPALPPSPTLLLWKGKAEGIDCTGESQTLSGVPPSQADLSGALARAFASAAQPNTVFVGSDQIKIVTQDPHMFFPERNMPSLEEITRQGSEAGLGSPVVIIFIVGITLGLISLAVIALSKMLQERNIQEQTTVRANIQVQAFETYTKARMDCYSSCIQKGNTVDACIKTCKTLVDKPNIDVTPRSGLKPDEGLGTLGTIGLVVVAGFGGLIAFKLYKRGAFDRFKSDDSDIIQNALPETT